MVMAYGVPHTCNDYMQLKGIWFVPSCLSSSKSPEPSKWYEVYVGNPIFCHAMPFTLLEKALFLPTFGITPPTTLINNRSLINGRSHSVSHQENCRDFFYKIRKLFFSQPRFNLKFLRSKLRIVNPERHHLDHVVDTTIENNEGLTFHNIHELFILSIDFEMNFLSLSNTTALGTSNRYYLVVFCIWYPNINFHLSFHRAKNKKVGRLPS